MNRKEQRKLMIEAVFARFFQLSKSLEEVRNSIIENFVEEDFDENSDNYLPVLTQTITNDEANFQELITKFLKKTWKLERIPKLDLAILEVAISEITSKNDIPFDVTVNEAVDMAKLYSTEQSPAFVNGILVKIFADIQTES